MSDQEYFYTFPDEYIKALIKIDLRDAGALSDICKRWNKKPAALLNDLALIETAKANKWLKSSP